MKLAINFLAVVASLAWLALCCGLLAFAVSLPFAALWGAFRLWGRLFGF